MSNKGVLLSIFTRVPVAGQVKTRLIPVLGVEGATELYTAMLDRTLRVARASSAEEINLCCTPVNSHPSIQELAEKYRLNTSVQYGQDLGERMHNAVREGVKSHSAVIILGCDCPSVELKDIDRAIEELGSGVDAVLGPALDGGYYLIGLREPCDYLFENVRWGSNSVLDTTRSRMRERGMRWSELPAYRDIDEKEDLASLENHKDFHAIIRDHAVLSKLVRSTA